MGPRLEDLTQLTGLRVIAAVWVVLFHVKYPYLVALPDWASSTLEHSALAIGLFFVLSGFVLSYAYLGGPFRVLNRRSFWVARFARLYPVYALAALFTAPLFFQEVQSRRAIAAELVLMPTMLQSWVPGMAGLWNTPAWSLSVEAFFYALFPFIAPPLMRWGWRRCLVGIAACCFLAATHLGIDLIPGGLANLVAIGTFPLFRLPEFIAGILLARVFQLHRQTQRLVASAPWLTVGAGALVLVTLANASRDHLLIVTAALPALFACLILGLALQGGKPSFLVSRPILLLGEASYALFLLHLGLAVWMSKLAQAAPQLAPVINAGWFLVVYLAISIGVAILVYFGVERPARTAIRRLLSPRPAAAEPVVASRQPGRASAA